jgi:hypothetical protein
MINPDDDFARLVQYARDTKCPQDKHILDNVGLATGILRAAIREYLGREEQVHPGRDITHLSHDDFHIDHRFRSYDLLLLNGPDFNANLGELRTFNLEFVSHQDAANLWFVANAYHLVAEAFYPHLPPSCSAFLIAFQAILSSEGQVIPPAPLSKFILEYISPPRTDAALLCSSCHGDTKQPTCPRDTQYVPLIDTDMDLEIPYSLSDEVPTQYVADGWQLWKKPNTSDPASQNIPDLPVVPDIDNGADDFEPEVVCDELGLVPPASSEIDEYTEEGEQVLESFSGKIETLSSDKAFVALVSSNGEVFRSDLPVQAFDGDDARVGYHFLLVSILRFMPDDKREIVTRIRGREPRIALAADELDMLKQFSRSQMR